MIVPWCPTAHASVADTTNTPLSVLPWGSGCCHVHGPPSPAKLPPLPPAVPPPVAPPAVPPLEPPEPPAEPPATPPPHFPDAMHSVRRESKSTQPAQQSRVTQAILTARPRPRKRP